jgi:hypothetical protein
MNIFNKVTLKSMKKNPVRTLVTHRNYYIDGDVHSGHNADDKSVFLCLQDGDI